MTARMLTMPRLGETMEEGVIVGWLVAPGAPFTRGQPILELETDKTVVEFPALGDGVLQDLLAGPGDRIAVGAPIARADLANPADWADGSVPVGDAAVAEAPAEVVNLLRMPRLGETMEEGVVVQWLVAEGAAYARGDAILEIETDKTVAEVPALAEGRLIRILAQPGARLAVGTPIAEVAGAVEPFEGETAAEVPAVDPPAVELPAIDPMPQTAPASAGRLRATPLARRIARQRGIALETLQGSGRRGRIERADVERAGAGAPAGQAWLDTPAGRIGYGVAGQGGQVLVLLHGFAGDRSAWVAMGAAIARAGHRAVMPDLPAHGTTDIAADDLGPLVEAACAVIAAQPGPVVLVGHSMGAAVAVAAAARLAGKVAELVLITPAGCGPVISADFVHGMAGATTAGEVAHLLRLLGPKGGGLSDAALAQMARDMARGRLAGLAGALASGQGRQRVDLIRALDSLPETLPVRAIFGTADRIVAATDALNLPPRVAVHFLPTGHMPQWDAPRDMLPLILPRVPHG